MKTHRTLIAILLLLAIAPGVSCAKGQKETTEQGSEASDLQKAPDTAASFGTDVAAVVNGVPISNSEFSQALKNTAMRMGMGAENSPNLIAQIGPRLLDQLITGEILYQQAVKDGYTASKESVDKAFSDLAARYSEPEAFTKEMGDRGYTEESLKQNITRQLTIQDYLEKTIASKVSVTEKDAREVYDQNPQMFSQQAQVRASHILINSVAADPQEKKDEAMKLAREIAVKAKKPGADFAALARQYSQCPSSAQGGDLGTFGPGKMVKPFEEAAFSMKVNETSDPVLTQFGYHIIKVTEKKDGAVMPFAEVKEELQQNLQNQKVNSAINDRIKELTQTSEVKVLISFPEPAPTSGGIPGHGGGMR